MLEPNTNSTSADVSPWTKNLLASWSIFSIILSLLGNTTVLVSSVCYKAIKLDKVSVVLIENIAVADLGETLFVILPTTWSLLTDQRTVFSFFTHDSLGKVLCYAVAHLQFLFPLASLFMICALNINKLVCLTSPLRSHVRSELPAYFVAFLAWSAYGLRILAVKMANEKVVYGHWEKGFRCGVDITKKVFWPDVVLMVLFGGVPTVVLSFCIVFMICIVSRVVKVKREAMVLNILVSLAFAVSVGPSVVRVVWLGVGVSTDLLPTCFKLWVVGVFTNYIMSFANPIIYYFSCRSFQNFIDRQIRKSLKASRNWCRGFRSIEVAETTGLLKSNL
ncbi:hypothetical protein ACHWQZ_G016633 [Mnemiopsis leidyi]